MEQGAQVRRNTMVRSPGEGRKKSKVVVSSPGALLAFLRGPHTPSHYCAHPRRRLPPTSVPGRHAGFGAAGCQARPGAGAAGRPQRLCPSARRGGRSWWPVVGGGLGNKAHQKLQPPSCPAQRSSWEEAGDGRCICFLLPSRGHTVSVPSALEPLSPQPGETLSPLVPQHFFSSPFITGFCAHVRQARDSDLP